MRPAVVLALIAHVDAAIVLSGILILRLVPLGREAARALLNGLFFKEHNVVLPVGPLLSKHGGFRVLEAAIVANPSSLDARVNHVLNAIKVDPGRLLLQAEQR